MKSKIKAKFLPPFYLQDNYAQLHGLSQGTIYVEEYTWEFEKFLTKCDLQDSEDQAIVRYLSGLVPGYSHIVELHQYTTFKDVYMLVHWVKQ